MSYPRSWLVAGITVSFAAGYLAAGDPAEDRESGNDAHQRLRMDSQSDSARPVGREVIEGKSWKESKERLMKRWEASPAVRVDFELRDETQRLLEKVSIAELEAWLRELRSDDEDEDSERDIQLQMHEMVLTVLAPRGAGPLIWLFTDHPTEGGADDVTEAMYRWTKHDPAAVLAWLDGAIPDAIRADLDEYREDALHELSQKKHADLEN